MYNLYINYYITIITLSILFFQYHALGENVENDDSALLNFIQNDLSSKDFINQDSMIHSMSENSENKYLRKRQASVKQESRKSVPKKTGKPKVPPKTPPVPMRKPSKPTAPKPSTGKPGVKRPPPKTTTRGPTTRRRSPTSTYKRPTGQLSRSTTKPASKSTTQRPVAPPKKPAPIPIKSKKTHRPATTTRHLTTTKPLTTTRRPTTTRSPTTTKSPTTAITTTNSASTSTFKPTPTIHLGPYEHEKLKLIKYINEARRLHQAQELEIDQELSNEAQILATQSARKQENIPDKDSTVGLLTYYSWPKEPFNAISHWYGGSYGFNYDDAEKITRYNSSFTQLVWRSTKKIGCGIDKTTKDEFFAACLLSPKGNKKGEFRENVRERIDKLKQI